MLIRNMMERDLPMVCEIENSIFSKPWSEKDFKESINNLNNLYLVAEKDEKVVGYCGFWGVVGEGQINNVAVKESYRGLGVARHMLTQMLEKGRNQGVEAFTLEVRVSNESAIALYRSLGFADSGIRKNFYENPREDAIIMWL